MGQGGLPLGSTTRRGGAKTTPKVKTPLNKKKKKGLTDDERRRRSELLAAASDAAGSMADRHKGGTHTPSGSGGAKSGASHNAKFLEVWHSGYKLEEPNM